jgi:hypothetical protein
MSVMLGDARAGKLADNMVGFGRTLRRAGLAVDSARISLAQQALRLIDIGRREDVRLALETVFVSKEQDRQVFVALFEAYFKNPDVAKQLLAQLLPQTKAPKSGPSRSARAQEALQVPRVNKTLKQDNTEEKIELDAAMSASAVNRLQHADFESLNASEYKLVEQLVREMPMILPTINSRRHRHANRGDQLNWSRLMREATRHDGDVLSLPFSKRRPNPLPLLVLVDISGSMQRYARLMLAFLHQATRHTVRSVYAFGTELTDLNRAFKFNDTDQMLALTNTLIADYGGGTRMGHALQTMHEQNARHIIGHRTVVLLITDGLDTGDPSTLSKHLGWLSRQARATVWLNPLLRYDGYQPLAAGAQVLHRHVDQMFAIHNLSHLGALARALKTLLNQVR